MVWYGALAGEGPARARPSSLVIISGVFEPCWPGVTETATATRGESTTVEFRPSLQHRLEISWKGAESEGSRARVVAIGVGTVHTSMSGVFGGDAAVIGHCSEDEKSHICEERLEITRKLSESRS